MFWIEVLLAWLGVGVLVAIVFGVLVRLDSGDEDGTV